MKAAVVAIALLVPTLVTAQPTPPGFSMYVVGLMTAPVATFRPARPQRSQKTPRTFYIEPL